MNTIALHYSFFSVGGIEQVLAFQVGLFKGLGFKVFLFLDREPTVEGRRLLPEGLDVVVLPANRPRRNDVIAREMRSRGAEIFYEHAHQMVMDRTSPAFGDLLFVKDSLGARYFLHWHSTVATPFMDYAPPGDVALLRAEFAPRVDGLCALSRPMEAFFRSFGLAAHYVPNKLVKNEGRLVERAFGDTVLWLGRISDEKHPEDAVRAFAGLRKLRPAAKMIMVGGGNLLGAVKSLAVRLGVADAIEFAGLRLDVENFYSRADVFLATSEFEGYPVAYVEAMSHGLPMVAYELSYIEPFIGNEGVVQVPFGDTAALTAALARTLGSVEKRQAMAVAARRRFEELQKFDQADFYAKLFAGTLSSESCPRSPDDVRAVEQMLFDAWRLREERMLGALRPLKSVIGFCRLLNALARLFCFSREQKVAWRRRKRTLKLLSRAMERQKS